MTYLEKYHHWINHPRLSKDDFEILSTMSPKDIEESFYQDIGFGTGGLRGLMGLGTNRINIYIIRKVTSGLAKYLKSLHLEHQGVAISYDNRFNSRLFAYEAAKVLAAEGIPSYIFKNLRPTPMLSFAVRYFKAAAGIMITASHNPKEYNGYKVYNPSGAQLNNEEANHVIKCINAIDDLFLIPTIANYLIKEIDEDFDDIYLGFVEKIAINNPQRASKIVYSPLHGTGGTLIPKLLKRHQYLVYPLESQMVVDPSFAATRSSNPEDEKSYEGSIEYAKKVDADIILVTDPDGDRLGVAVKHGNQYVCMTGNQTAALMLEYILKEKAPEKGFIYTTIVTSELIKKIAESYDHFVGETLTGFKYIGEQAKLIEGRYNYVFGCEESYGSLVSDFVRDKDAVQAVYMLSEMADFFKNKNMTLIDALNDVYRKYGYFAEYTENINLAGIEGARRIESIMTYFRNYGIRGSLSHEDYSSPVMMPHQIVLPASNVLKYYFENLWVVLRPSGTEPKLKVYFGAHDAHSTAEAMQNISNMKDMILKTIENIGE